MGAGMKMLAQERVSQGLFTSGMIFTGYISRLWLYQGIAMH
jgi:hypothetical protein